MGDILKEAIADAKAVRETALANAKMALEEAFTPQLKSMLSAKLKEDEHEDDEVEEFGHDDDDDDDEPEEGNHEDDEMGDEEDVPAEEAYEDEEMGDDEPDMEEEGVIEINGVKYAPVVAEDEHEEEGGEDEEEFEEELDLESIIKELEDELSEDEDEDEDKEEVDEADTSDDDTVDEADTSDDYTVDEADTSDDDTVDEELEIDESLFEEGEDDDDEEEVEESTGLASVHAELKEYKEAVVFLKDKLHEVNILNAKLLFTNKLFKEFSLDNNQKLKVVETFDRTQSTREIKLVYSTLAEQFSDNSTITRKHNIKESASSSVGSTKPSKGSRKVITEEAQVANRFKKLAGIIK